LISLSLKKRNKKYIVLTVFIILLTPAQIAVNTNDFAPAVFSFFFNFFLERNYSLRVLRPIALSLPIFLTLFWLFEYFKKRFF
tara:strand:+ start:975 stop:1223 length:249 start_codon:yes stop_codon:yes gene_type:complete